MDATELCDAFGNDVCTGLHRPGHLVEELVRADEVRCFDVPIRLLRLHLQIHGVRQPPTQQRVLLHPARL